MVSQKVKRISEKVQKIRLEQRIFDGLKYGTILFLLFAAVAERLGSGVWLSVFFLLCVLCCGSWSFLAGLGAFRDKEFIFAAGWPYPLERLFLGTSAAVIGILQMAFAMALVLPIVMLIFATYFIYP